MLDSPKPSAPIDRDATRDPSVGNDGDNTTGDDSPAPAFAAAADPAELGQLGPYRILKTLGRGGMGAVYLGFDSRLNRKLALKVMLPKFAANPAARERFLREARAAAQIAHDNVVTIYEADERDGTPFIAMQYLTGYSLEDYLKKKGTPSGPHVLRIARETAAGLAAAHKLGLVHRDIKPGNLWLEAPNGRVKVLDFGLAKPLDAESELTRSGAVVGTPAYMSPEQARGKAVDGRTDLFSLGVVLYRLCSGRLPFEGPSVMAVLMALGTEEPTPLRELNPAVPEPVAALIHQLLAKKPDDRPASAADVVKRLRELQTATAEVPTAMPVSTQAQPVLIPIPLTEPPESAFAHLADSHVETASGTAAAAGSADVPRAPKKRRPWLLIGASLAFVALAVAVGQIIIKIKNPDGTETEIKVPNGSGVEVNGKTIIPVKSPGTAQSPGTAVPGLSPWTPPATIPVGQSPFDKLDPNAIPKDERFDWQPKELVGMIGTHARRHWRMIAAAAISDDGTMAATVEFDGGGEVIIWDIATQTPLRQFRQDGAVERLQFTKDGKQLYLFGRPAIRLYDIAADPPTPVKVENVPNYQARFSGHFLEGGKTFCAHNGDVALFAMDGKGKPEGERRKTTTNSRICSLVCVSATTNQIYYADADGQLCRATVKDAQFTAEEVLPIKSLPNDFPRGLSPDGKLLAVGDEKGLVIWDVSAKEPKEAACFPWEHGNRETVVVFSPCGRWIVTRRGGAGARLWKAEGREPNVVAVLDRNDTYIGDAAFTKDGNTVVLGNESGFVRFWDLRGEQPKELSPFDPATAFEHNIYHQTLIRLSRTSGQVMLPRFDLDPELKRSRWQLWSFDGREPRPALGPTEFAANDAGFGNIWGRFDPAGPKAWVQVWNWSSGGRAGRVELDNGRWPRATETFCDSSHGLVTPDGKQFIAITGDGTNTVEGWDVTAKPTKRWSISHPAKHPLQAREWSECVIVASHDGGRFATITDTDKVHATEAMIFQREGDKPVHQMTIPMADSQALWYIAAMSPDGRFYAHSQSTHTHEPEVLDVTGKEPKKLGNLPKVLGRIHWLGYSPDGRHLAAAGDKGVAVFDAKTLQPVWKWDTSPGPIHWLDWAADGRHLVTTTGTRRCTCCG